MTLESLHSGLSVTVNVEPIIKSFIDNRYPDSILLEVQLSQFIPEKTDHQTPIQHLYGLYFEHAFISYYSKIEKNLKQKFGTAQDAWPSEVIFAWIIRNGFGHGRRIKVTNQKLIGAWRGLQLDSTYQDNPILYLHLSQADILILMLDLEAHFTSLN